MAATEQHEPQKRLERIRQLPDEHKKRVVRIWTILGILIVITIWVALQLIVTPLLPKDTSESLLDESISASLEEAPTIFSEARDAFDDGIRRIQNIINEQSQPEGTITHLQPAADAQAEVSATSSSTTTATTTSP